MDSTLITTSGDQPDEAIQLQTAGERIGIYKLLAALLREPPDATLLAQLASAELPEPELDEPPLTVAWRALQSAAHTADPSTVDEEFQQLFIGLGGGEVQPYASWYLSGALMDRSLVALRSDLARLAITRYDDNKEPEDHASALCETMALLAEPTDGVSLAEQRNFLSMHIASWMGRFFADIATAKSADFYRAVAALGSAFLSVEQPWLSLP
ncbi:MAG: molecular chaperone TorD family protein [Rhodanobacter sp.]